MPVSNKTIIIMCLIVLIALLLLSSSSVEKYSSKVRSLNPSEDQYYIWKAFGNPTDGYPFNRQWHPHPARFDFYKPAFLTHGYGHF